MPSASSLQELAPDSAEQAAEALAAAASRREVVRVVGGGTRLDWGNPVESPAVALRTHRLDRVIEHNVGDLTAVLQAGVKVTDAQEAFAAAGQMLALDAPTGPGDGATIGGLVATADSGPLRHRYGGVRDLILGVTAALPDGSVARAGGRVIKNVAGYDLAKLNSGALGTLGTVVEAVFRLHPRPSATVSAVARTPDADGLARAAAAAARAPLELLALDVGWGDGTGTLLARAGGRAAGELAASAARAMQGAGLAAELVEDDDPLWSAQRDRQRAPQGGLAIRVSGVPAQLAEAARAAEALGATLVGRAGLGLFWITLEESEPEAAAEALARCRQRLSPSPCVVVGAPEPVRRALDPWGLADGPELALMRRLRQRFDPERVCNAGIHVGGI